MKVQGVIGLFLVAVFGGVTAVASYVYLTGDENKVHVVEKTIVAHPSELTSMYSTPSTGLDFTMAAEKTIHAVVHVKTQASMEGVHNPWFELFGYEMEDQVQHGSGSGVIISPNGYIVTNNHVVAGAQEIEISLNNNKTYKAKVIGTDPSTDIALVKIEADNLPTVSFGDSDEVKIGEWVLAVGNPFDLTSTVTAGIVSAKARNINILQSDDLQGIFPIESFIQTDAAVNPGNSGGALVNTRGELIGINTAIASRTGSYSGYSFAVPVTIVEKVTKDLMEFGHVQRAFIGVRIAEMTEELADNVGLKQVEGVYVSNLVENGAAQEAGIEPGDVILQVGGKSVTSVPELQEQVSRFRPGDNVAIQIWRDGASRNLDMQLRNQAGFAELEDFSTKEMTALLGAKFEDITERQKEQLQIPGGARISALGSGKLSQSGVKESFIITKVDGHKVYDSTGLEELMKNKTGGVLIEGVYPNGSKAYYGFGM